MRTLGQPSPHRRRALTSLAVLAGAAGLVGTLWAAPATASTSASAAKVVVLWGDGVAALLGQGTLVGAHFGWAETSAIGGLDSALGPPKTAAPVKESGNCDIDAVMQWPALTGYFNHGRFVGYSTLSPAGRPLSTAVVATLDGLRVGNTLTEARQIYGDKLRISAAQGGSWSATTANGTVEGYLTGEIGRKSATPRIMSIEAGAVGCPAATP